MNPIELIQKHFDEFTNNEKEIAYYVINNPFDTSRGNIIGIANATKTSKSSVIRFAQKLGYEGYSQFKFDLARSLVSQDSGTSEESYLNVIDLYIEYLNKLKQSIDKNDIFLVAKSIINAKRIKIIGFNRTYNSAKQLSMRLLKIGIDAQSIDDYMSVEDILSIYDRNDIIICISIADNYKKINTIVQSANSNNVPAHLITMSPNLPFKKYTSSYTVLPRISKSNYSSFLDDQAIFFIYIEVLLNEIAKILNNNWLLVYSLLSPFFIHNINYS